jgi:hypothetical protein
MFDANNFMSAVFEEANDTKRTPCPAGEFQAMIEKVEPKTGIIGKGERQGQAWGGLNVSYSVQDPAVLQLLGRDKCIVTDLVMLDLTPAGGLDMGPGKNIGLGRLREAVGLNQKGQPFSPMMLNGRFVKVAIKHVPGYRDPSSMEAEVSGVVKA